MIFDFIINVEILLNRINHYDIFTYRMFYCKCHVCNWDMVHSFLPIFHFCIQNNLIQRIALSTYIWNLGNKIWIYWLIDLLFAYSFGLMQMPLPEQLFLSSQLATEQSCPVQPLLQEHVSRPMQSPLPKQLYTCEHEWLLQLIPSHSGSHWHTFVATHNPWPEQELVPSQEKFAQLSPHLPLLHSEQFSP